ncbi:MAG: radical SAM protein [bacterium]|nr:radical SAM protein [bacterium]
MSQISSEFDILRQSPHDGLPAEGDEPLRLDTSSEIVGWIPSRYNVRAGTPDGRLILWNTYRGSMSVFRTELRADVEMLLRRRGIESRPEGLGKYLYDRGFLVPVGTHEHRRHQLTFGQQQYRSDTLELFLLASEDCNFRCQYCYEQFTRGTMSPGVRTAVKKLVGKRLPGLRHLSIRWFGGEPLYGFEAIEDLAPFFHETAEEHSITLRNHITTNAYLLTPEIVDKLLGWRISNYQITIDGAPENHDRNRPTRDGRGTFWTILNNLRALRRRRDDYTACIRVNFDKQNYPNMKSCIELLGAEFGGDSRFLIRFHAVGRWGGTRDEELTVCGRDEATQLRMHLNKLSHECGLSVGGGLKEVRGPGAQVCYAARPYSFIIGASGKVMKCTVALDMKEENVVGRLTPEGDLGLDTGKLALWTQPAAENGEKCRKCVLGPTCQGLACPKRRLEEGEPPCPALRLNLKNELRETLEIGERDGCKVKVRSAALPRMRSLGMRSLAPEQAPEPVLITGGH